MNSRFARAMDTFGRPVIGLTRMTEDIIGYRGRGSKLPSRVICGPLDIGDGAVAPSFSTQDIGDQPWASTVVSTTDSGTWDTATKVATGTADTSTITAK